MVHVDVRGARPIGKHDRIVPGVRCKVVDASGQDLGHKGRDAGGIGI